MSTTLQTRVQSKRDTSANWTQNNPVLLDGEVIIVDTNAGETRFKIGDGTSTYTQLPFQDESIRNLIPEASPKTVRFVVGTSTAGWTADDCDYLCDGTDDQVEINAAIQALPSTGGEIKILDGTYNITEEISITRSKYTIMGNGSNTVLKRMFNTSAGFEKGLIRLSAGGDTYTCIKNLLIDGNSSNYSKAQNCGITISHGNFNTFSEIIFINCIVGIVTTNNNNNSIIHNTFKNCNVGIKVEFSDKNIITNNICIRGTGQPSDYTSSQYPIYVYGSDYNLITNNNIMGKDVRILSGTGNTVYGNKWNDTIDILITPSGTQGQVLGYISDNVVGAIDLPQGKIVISATVANSNWASSGSYVYQQITCEGMTVNSLPFVVPQYNVLNDSQQNDWNKIVYIESFEGYCRIYAKASFANNINVMITY